ncbi:hypothetical protein CWE08_01060 [Aliidiomarina iranensis]|uniref:Probable beta-carotene 15,15'-dioxygenase n=1 Tax=Aliidiomarina iranensis TaxID=1434071 RepID=A0A432W356_9GAMM|nr:Brp/Blh family beta-carotene 15,15'-dioxygenase [Aliidiomarina iranensis]RUO23672.1 hypothetical protein CWE08_01060 [Aliidiomarina iranensis]
MLELSPFVLVVLTLAVLAGLPHGAFDFYIAKRLGQLQSIPQQAFWASRYLAIGIGFIAFWVVFPVAGLSVFLFVSALHFGRDYYPQQHGLALAAGTIILGLPMLFNATIVNTIFNQLMVTPVQAEWIINITLVFMAVAAGMIFLDLLKSGKKALSQRANLIIALGALFWSAVLFHPLIYFALFFALLHSPKHMREQWAKLDSNQRKTALGVIAALTVMPILAAGVVGTMLQGTWDQRLITLIFIGLAALTMPHMVLLEREHHALGMANRDDKTDG